jgi:hypothetical protein
MRFVIVLVAVALLAGGCSDSKNSSSDSRPTSTPSTTELTVKDLIVDAGELPGCTLDRQGEAVIRAISQSFNCGPNGAADPRVTAVVSFTSETAQEAELALSNAWSTMDAARDTIRQQVLFRPVDPNSLQIQNAKEQFGSIGAEQEYVYCATFSDGLNKALMYFGAFRHRNVRFEWTTFQTNADCNSPSRARELGMAVAKQQLAKLKTRLPGGFIVAPTATPTVAPTR